MATNTSLEKKMNLLAINLDEISRNQVITKKTWVAPTIQSFSIHNKTEGGGDPTPEFLGGFGAS